MRSKLLTFAATGVAGVALVAGVGMAAAQTGDGARPPVTSPMSGYGSMDEMHAAMPESMRAMDPDSMMAGGMASMMAGGMSGMSGMSGMGAGMGRGMSGGMTSDMSGQHEQHHK